MAWDTNGLEDEAVFDELEHVVSEKVEPLYLVVTDSALYLPRKKLLAISDPYYLERVDKTWIQDIAFDGHRQHSLLTAVFITTPLAVGLIWVLIQVGVPLLSPLALISLISIAAITYFAVRIPKVHLSIRYMGGNFDWLSPAIVSYSARLRLTARIELFLRRCADAGIASRRAGGRVQMINPLSQRGERLLEAVAHSGPSPLEKVVGSILRIDRVWMYIKGLVFVCLLSGAGGYGAALFVRNPTGERLFLMLLGCLVPLALIGISIWGERTKHGGERIFARFLLAAVILAYCAGFWIGYGKTHPAAPAKSSPIHSD